MKKRVFVSAGIFLLLVSCQTQVVNQVKPLHDNTLELYQKYTIQTNDSKIQKVQVLKTDSENIYAKDKNGQKVTIPRKEVHEIKKFDLLASVAIIAAAIAALVFIPV
ncbi:bacteriophage spanin2 family protein [Daejeonia sp. YH14]|uniref:bacteriophage spanin2 family protein n=1 Tax=Daejeonia sp. YH14 TaxID=3439042 RepID=UPI003F491723